MRVLHSYLVGVIGNRSQHARTACRAGVGSITGPCGVDDAGSEAAALGPDELEHFITTASRRSQQWTSSYLAFAGSGVPSVCQPRGEANAVLGDRKSV